MAQPRPLSEAVEKVGVRQVVPLRINGKSLPIDDSRLIEVYSSAKGKIVHHAASASVKDAEAAAAAAQSAFASWSRSSYEKRRDLLLRVADIYERNAADLVAIQVAETSCSENYARFNVDLATSMLKETASAVLTALTGEVPPLTGAGYGFTFKEAIGPVLIIPPWNSAIILSTRGIAAAIAAGCTVVLKASELCPLTHAHVVAAFEEAGLPTGCINQIQANRADAGAVTEALVAHRAIRKIDFIGSASVGRIIGSLAGKHLKPVLMELGGKSPAIVLKDADLAAAAKFVAFGAFLHAGQICMSTERVIVEASVAEAFQKVLVEEVNTNFSGHVGYNVTASSAKRAHDMLEAAKTSGAKFLVGDNSFLDPTKASLKPTIVAEIPPSAEMYDAETFGPSTSFYVARDIDHAIEMANESAYGLNATIHTSDAMQALSIARRLEYGQVHVNTTTLYDQACMPISGAKNSGWGSANGKFGIAEFLLNKSVTLHESTEGSSFGGGKM